MGHNARYGTPLCALSAISLLTRYTHALRMALWYFAVLSSIIHPHMFTLSSCRCTYTCVVNRVWENGKNLAQDETSSKGCSCFSYLSFLFFAYIFSPFIITQWAFYVSDSEHFVGRRLCWAARREGTRLQTKTRSKIGVRRFSGGAATPVVASMTQLRKDE